jgi:hypothetical protein
MAATTSSARVVTMRVVHDYRLFSIRLFLFDEVLRIRELRLDGLVAGNQRVSSGVPSLRAHRCRGMTLFGEIDAWARKIQPRVACFVGEVST